MTLAVNIAQGASNNVTFRNRIINGGMVIDQRNAGASVTANNVYSLDRWLAISDTSNKWTVQQNAGSVTPPTGFTNYLGCTSLSAYTPISTDYFGPNQRIEGYNVADLNWGSSSASPITLSFWVRSSLTGSFGGSIQNSSQNRSYAFPYTISSANTWEYKTITIAGDTSGTWLTTNGIGFVVHFSLGAGSSRVGTASTWTGTSNVFAPTGSVNVVGTNGATFYITGVQLEAGTTASPFEYRQYGAELYLCQRYYTSLPSQGSFFGAHAFSTNRVISSAFYPATMRATPTVTSASNAYTYFINGAAYTSSASGTTANLYGNLIIDITVTATSGSNGVISLNSTISLSAEL